MERAILTLVFCAIFAVSACGQGLGNLDFESPQNLPGNPGNGVLLPVTNALPGWTAYDGSLALSQVYYVSNNAGASSSVELEGGSLALSGNFSVGLDSDGSISQTGLVPNNAESLEFEANPALNLEVTLGGQNLSYSAISQGAGYTVYGADIPSNLDGQMEALVFGVNGPGGIALLDNIEFSTSSVPEPGEWAFVGLWAAFFAVHRRRGRQR